MKAIIPIVILSLLLVGCEQLLNSRLALDNNELTTSDITGDYLGQRLPNDNPEIFAQNIICNGLVNRDITITPDGNEIYYTNSTTDFSFATVFVIRRENGNWSKPKIVEFGRNPKYVTIEPCLSYDGNTLFFASNRPLPDSSKLDDMNIWKVERNNNNWGNPIPLDSTINTNQGEYYPSVTQDGTLYFTREELNRVNVIYRSFNENGNYSTPQRLPKQVNCGNNRFNAYIAQNHHYIIIPALGVEKDVSGANYYISFRDNNDYWSDPINMGNKINKDLGRGWSASLSPKGDLLFFMSSRGIDEEYIPAKLTSDFFDKLQSRIQNGNADIYWMNSSIIDELKKQAVFNSNL